MRRPLEGPQALRPRRRADTGRHGSDAAVEGADDLLELQRQAGNRAVAGLVQRFELADEGSPAERAAEAVATSLGEDHEDHPGGAGTQRGVGGLPGAALGRRSALSPALAASVQRLMGRGRPIATASRAPVEHAFGRSFAGVHLHDDAESDRLASSMGAAAFTTGNDVFLGAQARHTEGEVGRHALAHELAHVASRPGATRAGAPVTIQRWSFGDLFRSKEQVQERKDKKAAKAKEAKETATENLSDSTAYERSLGAYLFNHPRANYAAATVIDKLITALVGDFDETSKAQQDQITKAFGANSKKPLGELQSSAGQVGTTFEPVWGALRSGNLRERMTAIYNAMFGEFKSVVTKIMNDSAWEEAEAKGLNVTKLKRRKRQMKFTPFAKDLYRDPGNPVDRKNYSSWENTGTTRDAVKETSGRKVGDLDQGKFPISLSERERAFQFPDKDESEADDEKLKWMEGGTFWKMRQDNKWVKKVEQGLHMPTMAGPSGTTLRFFQMWEFLKKPVPAADMRAAVLGYMLSSNDHSFHEMMMTAKDYGLPYSPGLRAYRDVAPLGEQELRANVAIERTFPDEKAFARKMDKGKFNLTTPDQESTVEDIDDVEDLDMTDVEKRILQSLVSYTDEDPSAYKFMNNAFGGGLVSLKFMKFIKEDSHLAPLYKQNKFKIKDLIEESKELSFHAAGMLSGPTFTPYVGKVYRGQKAFFTGWIRPGAEISEKKFLSTSTDRSTAEGFANKGMGTKKVLIEMDSKTGRDVDAFSMVQGENEVLFPPGSKFRIETAPTDDGNGYLVTKWTDVSEPPKDKKDDFKPEALKNLEFDPGDYGQQPVTAPTTAPSTTTGSTAPSGTAVDPARVIQYFKKFDGYGDLINQSMISEFVKIASTFSLDQMTSLDDTTKQQILTIVGCDAVDLNDAMDQAYGDDSAKIFSDPVQSPPVTVPTTTSPKVSEPPKGAPKSAIKATAPLILGGLGVTLSLEQLAALRDESLSFADVFTKEQLEAIMGGGVGVAGDMQAMMDALNVGDMWLGMQLIKAMKVSDNKAKKAPESVKVDSPPPQIVSSTTGSPSGVLDTSTDSELDSEVVSLVEGPLKMKDLKLPLPLAYGNGKEVAVDTHVLITGLVKGTMIRIDIAHGGSIYVTPAAFLAAMKPAFPELASL